MGVFAALVCGFAAKRVRLPIIVGYVIGGLLVGPSTPGFTADEHAALQLGEFGVIFMMFGVGLHFSLRDLASVNRVAVPGALLQTIRSRTQMVRFAPLPRDVVERELAKRGTLRVSQPAPFAPMVIARDATRPAA